MAKIDIPRPGKLVRSRNGLYPGIIPRDIRRALNLAPHDRFEWLVETDGLKLKFLTPPGSLGTGRATVDSSEVPA
jgi:hypothetical protein